MTTLYVIASFLAGALVMRFFFTRFLIPQMTATFESVLSSGGSPLVRVMAKHQVLEELKADTPTDPHAWAEQKLEELGDEAEAIGRNASPHRQ